MKYQSSKICLLVGIICLSSTLNLCYADKTTTSGPTTKGATGKTTIGGTGTTTSRHSTTHVTTTLSPAQKLVMAIDADSKKFQSIKDAIDGKKAAPSSKPTPAAAPKKQINLSVNNQVKESQPKKKEKEDKVMAEIEKTNLMNSPSAPNSEPKTNKGPAAQSISRPSGSSSSSSSKSSSGSNNGKIIGSAVGGGLAGVALIVGTVFAVVHAKRKSKNKDEESGPATDIADENEYGGIEEDVE